MQEGLTRESVAVAILSRSAIVRELKKTPARTCDVQRLERDGVLVFSAVKRGRRSRE